ncbi:MAG: cupredoxin domain-containing protein [Patescibacteria group bacterium]
MKNIKILGAILSLVILGGSGWYFYSMKEGEVAQNNENMAQTPSQISTPDLTTSEETIKEIAVSSKNFEYSVREIRVKKGDKIRINFTNTEGFHDWVIDEFNAKTEKINAGGSSSIEFTADKTGAFEYYCSVGSHRQMGMVGKLIVE